MAPADRRVRRVADYKQQIDQTELKSLIIVVCDPPTRYHGADRSVT